MSRREEEIRRVAAELQARLAELEAVTEALSRSLAAGTLSEGQEREGDPFETG